MPVAWREWRSRQAGAEARIEGQLVSRGDRRIVEVIVAVGIEHAVGEDRRRDTHGDAQQQLQEVSRPDVAAGLIDVLARDHGIEAVGHPGKLSRRFEKPAVQERVQCALVSLHCFPYDIPQGQTDAHPHGPLLRFGLRRAFQFGGHCCKEVVQMPFVGSLRAAGVDRPEPRQAGIARVPKHHTTVGRDPG